MTQEQLIAAQQALFARSRSVYEETLTPRASSSESQVAAGGAATATGGGAEGERHIDKKPKVEIEGEASAAGAMPEGPKAEGVGEEGVEPEPAMPLPVSGLGATTLAGMEDEDDDYDDI